MSSVKRLQNEDKFVTKPGYSLGRPMDLSREFVEMVLESHLTSFSQMEYREKISFSMLPETLRIYVGELKQQEKSSDEGTVLTRINGKKRSQLREGNSVRKYASSKEA